MGLLLPSFLRSLIPPLRGARAALTLLTQLPVGGFPYSEDDWRWAAAWFPLVGAALGVVAAGTFQLFAARGAPLVAAGLTIGFVVLVTGALHEDGLADSADALGGAASRPQLFAILKDSRIGSFGAVATVLSLLLRIASVAHLGGQAAVALITAHCLSRLAPVWLMAALPYVTPAGTGKSAVLAQVTRRQSVMATGLALAVLGALVKGHQLDLFIALLMFTLAGLLALLAGWRFWVRAGGITGDFLGATQQLVETGTLVAFTQLA